MDRWLYSNKYKILSLLMNTKWLSIMVASFGKKKIDEMKSSSNSKGLVSGITEIKLLCISYSRHSEQMAIHECVIKSGKHSLDGNDCTAVILQQ